MTEEIENEAKFANITAKLLKCYVSIETNRLKWFEEYSRDTIWRYYTKKAIKKANIV